jgi:putative transposase
LIYHALNRSNRGDRLFHKAADYEAFVAVLSEAAARYPGVAVLAYCVMPNHWHLVLKPTADDELSLFMGWLTNAHVRRHHQHYGTYGQGHVYQGRFKSFPVQEDQHLLILLRYVEANPMRAKLVDSSDAWRWSSMAARHAGVSWLAPWPVDEPQDWLQIVNDRASAEDPILVDSFKRGKPFGSDRWIQRTAKRLNLTGTTKPRGRPKAKRKASTGRDATQ